jgi:hypothetical protein
MRLTNFRLLTPLLLPLGGLPAAHEFPALRVLAVPLIPPPGPVDAVTPAAQADPQAKTAAAGRKSLAETMLELSQGEGLLSAGPPERSAKSLGHSCLISSPSLDEMTAALNLARPCRPDPSSATARALWPEFAPA